MFAPGVEDELTRSGCSAGSCLNGGTCVDRVRVCRCPPGYQGRQCQVRVTSRDYDVTDPCASLGCLHGSECFVDNDAAGRPTASCRCSDDWTGKHCQVRQ